MIQTTLTPNPSGVTADMAMDSAKMDMDTCPFPNDKAKHYCNPSSTFRSMDGSCNNLKHPLWGRAMTPLRRALEPDYCDSKWTPTSL